MSNQRRCTCSSGHYK
jgi:hypothetical protein